MGVYRGLWRYVSIESLVVYAKAVLVGSAASALVLLALNRFQGFSRAVFILDAVLLLVLLGGSRIAFRIFRSLLPGPAVGGPGRRVLIYGAGDAGSLLLRELRNNRNWQCQPVGFLDDDPLKKGKLIHGLRVLGGNGSFTRICREQQVEEVLISTTHIPADRLQQILHECQTAQVHLKRLQIRIESLVAATRDEQSATGE
jgi:UDP-GlcNAc:undecaprenyl-phosphate GlcNAc-1-phosphate transferase